MTFLIVMALSWLTESAAAQNASLHEGEDSISNNLTISLITCYPGEEIYELCGHSAIRVRGEGIDSVWNYGIFDFNQPNFVYRFVKGETDYRGASYPFQWFFPEYVATGRKVVEQDLNLTPEETKELLTGLRVSVKPENAVYRYNYVKDNCSTRILNQLDSASEVPVIYPDSVRYGTFRKAMESYHKNYPWYQFGIDLALGSGLDEKIGTREEMFVPLELMNNVATAHFADGRPLVKATRVLNEGETDATLPPTPFALSPLFWSWILALLIAISCAYSLIKKKLLAAVTAVWFTLLGLAGCLIAFLVFISVHEATSPNVLILWLNPFQFLFAFGLGIKKLRILAKVMSWYNVGVVGCLILVSPFITQSLNAAFFPLMLSTVALAATYVILTYKRSL